jgi:Uma2 family endonuclease
MVLRKRDDAYADSHPSAADVLVLVEVADSSARYDREVKVPLYARHGVVEVWIIDLDAAQVCSYRNRTDDGYSDVHCTSLPGPSPLPGLENLTVELAGLLR